MVDVVVNHNGWNGSPDTVDYSSFNPFNEKSQYHTPYCPIDYSNLNDLENIHTCWIGDQKVPLPVPIPRNFGTSLRQSHLRANNLKSG